MPISSHFIGGPSRCFDAQTIVTLAKSMGMNFNYFYHLLVRATSFEKMYGKSHRHSIAESAIIANHVILSYLLCIPFDGG